MPGVKVEITRCVEYDYPGWVECRLVDAWGREWLFVDKVPVVTEEDFDSDGAPPLSVAIGCEIVQRRRDSDGREIVCVDTEKPWDIESVDGEYRFEVLAEQVVFF